MSYGDAMNVNARMLWLESDYSALPAVKVSSDSHQLICPFAAVGIDYFGPLYVHAGPLTRSMWKNQSFKSATVVSLPASGTELSTLNSQAT